MVKTKQKIKKIIENILRVSLILAIIISILEGSWEIVFISLLTFILSYLPSWLKNKYQLEIPLDFELGIILFIYASLFLGEIKRFYDLFWWWDIILHALSGIAFGCLGFIILFLLNKANKIKANPFWICLFALAFASFIAVIWEIFEFFMDQIWGTYMQRSLFNTMTDLVVGIGGAAIAIWSGFNFMQGKEKSFLGRLITFLVEKNSRLNS
ncbi:MAG TPA: hypothetical protein VJ895_00700 [Candidatus Nanoarchaeia archaeon]|nr:hypothetical protein [Candidatus Nanoarchaeia archaeon]